MTPNLATVPGADARARAYALKVHSPVRYARDLIALIERAQKDGPALRTSMEFGRVLASIGLGEGDPAVRGVAEVLNGMLG
jgi:hypothetical protein